MKNKMIRLTIVMLGFLMITGFGHETGSGVIGSYATEIASISVPENVKVVGLGEATHGNVEFQVQKLEVFKALVNNNGCRVFAIEGDFGGCRKVNEYISGAEGTVQDAIKEIGFEMYQTKEMAELIEWMREYNQKSQEKDRLRFYGFDMQRYDNNKEYLFKYLERVNPDMITQYQLLLSDLNDDTVYTQNKELIKKSLENINLLIAEMQSNKESYVKISSEDEFSLALEFAESIKENAVMQNSGSNYSQIRDKYMSQKIKWISEYEDGKMIFITGHNGHVEKSLLYRTYTSMGKYLDDEFEDDYYAIGTDFGNNTFRAYTPNGSVKNFNITNKNELIESFASLSGNEYFMDFEAAKADAGLKSVIENSQAMGNVGAQFSDWQTLSKKFYTINMIPGKAYDGIIVVKEATPTIIERK
ncbi:MAG: erythromycin esterase family protein [Proteocatella sp.]